MKCIPREIRVLQVDPPGNKMRGQWMAASKPDSYRDNKNKMVEMLGIIMYPSLKEQTAKLVQVR